MLDGDLPYLSGPAPYVDLVRRCMSETKNAGYIQKAYVDLSQGPYCPDRRLRAHTLAAWDWTSEAVCKRIGDALDRYFADARDVYWRKLPELRMITGDDGADIYGDRYGIGTVVLFKRPYWILSLRVAIDTGTVDPIQDPSPKPAMCGKVEGEEVWGPCFREQRAREVGVASAWIHKNWHTGEILGPEPPPLSRAWHAPHPPGAKMIS